MNAVYFISFIISAQYTMLNLFILILMQQFEQNYINTENPLNQFRQTQTIIQELWLKACDRKNILYIKKEDLIELYLKLDKPYGIGFNIMYNEELFSSLQEYQEIYKTQQKQAFLNIMRMGIQYNEFNMAFYNEIIFKIFELQFHSVQQTRNKAYYNGLRQVDDAEKQTLQVIQKLMENNPFNPSVFQIAQQKTQDRYYQKFNYIEDLLQKSIVYKSWYNFSRKWVELKGKDDSDQQNNQQENQLRTVNSELNEPEKWFQKDFHQKKEIHKKEDIIRKRSYKKSNTVKFGKINILSKKRLSQEDIIYENEHFFKNRQSNPQYILNIQDNRNNSDEVDYQYDY